MTEINLTDIHVLRTAVSAIRAGGSEAGYAHADRLAVQSLRITDRDNLYTGILDAVIAAELYAGPMHKGWLSAVRAGAEMNRDTVADLPPKGDVTMADLRIARQAITAIRVTGGMAGTETKNRAQNRSDRLAVESLMTEDRDQLRTTLLAYLNAARQAAMETGWVAPVWQGTYIAAIEAAREAILASR